MDYIQFGEKYEPYILKRLRWSSVHRTGKSNYSKSAAKAKCSLPKEYIIQVVYLPHFRCSLSKSIGLYVFHNFKGTVVKSNSP